MHFDINQLIAAGVFTHLLAATAKTFLRSHTDQNKIDALSGKVDGVLNTLTQVALAVPAPGQVPAAVAVAAPAASPEPTPGGAS